MVKTNTGHRSKDEKNHQRYEMLCVNEITWTTCGLLFSYFHICIGLHDSKYFKSLAVASIAQDVGSSSTNRSSDIIHYIIKSN